MRAIVITAPGGLDVLDVVERPVRDPGPGEVRIAVRAAAVNPTDIGLRQGGGWASRTARRSPRPPRCP